MYREYTVMQPLQRSYAITIERINNMVASGALNSLYDAAKVAKLENAEELTGKDKRSFRIIWIINLFAKRLCRHYTIMFPMSCLCRQNLS